MSSSRMAWMPATSASGEPPIGPPVLKLIHDLDVRVVHAVTGEILRTLTIDPDRR